MMGRVAQANKRVARVFALATGFGLGGPANTRFARHLCRICQPLSTCRLASRWKEGMAFLRSFYVADDIWRFAWSLVGCLLALSWLPPRRHVRSRPWVVSGGVGGKRA